ncbi:MAG: UvrD-helicase domain-containing protein, partial [Actinomycetota bacterium]
GLVASAVRLLAENPDIVGAFSARFPHVLVDDAQEMSATHLELLAGMQGAEVTVAADPNSSIEVFRGAQPDWVFGFGKWFPGHTEILLRRGHRIGSPLSGALDRLIEHNDAGISERAPEPAGHATQFGCRLYGSVSEECEAIAREFRALHLNHRVAWSRMAALISQPSYLLDPLRRAFDQWEVPYQAMLRERPLSGEPAVARFLDLARVSLDPAWGERLPEVLTSPLVGLDFSTLRQLEREAWRRNVDLAEIAEEAPETAEFRRLRDLIVQNRDSADQCFWMVFRSSAYYSEMSSRTPGASPETDAVAAFINVLGRFVERRHGRGSIDEYLTEAARADFGADPWLSTPPRRDAVPIVSFHAVRPGEFHTVAVMGCLDQWIPKGRRAQGLFDPFVLKAADPAEREVEAIADDRRTFYVAASRATSNVIFTASASAGGRGRPSRFLFELAAEAPAYQAPGRPPPLTERELAAALRRTLASPESSPPDRVAALLALAEIPGVDPRRWYGVHAWTAGSVPITQGELRTSFSRLDAYENCGLQYLLQSVLGLDPASTHSMKFGTWIHALFQAVHEKKIV